MRDGPAVKHLNLRLPANLHEDLRRAADLERRSLNSEIVRRLADGLYDRAPAEVIEVAGVPYVRAEVET